MTSYCHRHQATFEDDDAPKHVACFQIQAAQMQEAAANEQITYYREAQEALKKGT